jgi:hypothetical protein
MSSVREDLRKMRTVVAKLKRDPRDGKVRRAVCLASRFLWIEVRNLHQEAPGALNVELARQIDEVFSTAEKELSCEDDRCFRNVRQRYRTSKRALRPVLAEAMAEMVRDRTETKLRPALSQS